MDHCCLFTPCLRIDALDRKRAFGCGMVVLDLEDSVHVTQKDAARTALAGYDFHRLDHLNLTLGLRINPIDTPDGLRDLLLLEQLYQRSDFPVTLINVPKVHGPGDMLIYRRLFAEIAPDVQIMPLIETIDAVNQIEPIAALSDALLYGQADLSAEMYMPNQHFLHHARARICIAAARNAIPAIDTNSFEINDMAVLQRECEVSRDAGFMGKAVIHPNQVDTIRRVFSVPEETRRNLEETVASYDATGKGFAIRSDKVVAPPFVLHAKRMLSFMDQHLARTPEAAE